jgi:LPS sulfotransferase NodH
LPSLISQLRKNRLPDFLGIGAMRSGTSWLRKHLNNHPRVWMAEPKEVHFFDRHFEERRWPLLSSEREARLRYGAYFAEAPTESGTVTGEFTPAYAVLPDERIATIRRWMPDLKVVFIMRDPVERAWSHARKDFAKYWGKEPGSATLDDLRPFFDDPNVHRRGDYLSCLRAWLAYFPRERFLLSCMEDIVADPHDLLRAHFEFLGVDPALAKEDPELAKPVNPRPKTPLPRGVREYLEASLYPQNEALEVLLGRKVPWA